MKNTLKNIIILLIILLIILIILFVLIIFSRNWKTTYNTIQIRENMTEVDTLLNPDDKINKYSKGDLCLDLDEKENKLIMKKCIDTDSQNWIHTLIGGDTNLYNLHNQKLNKEHNPKCLDIVNDGENNILIMNQCGNYSGQQWTIPNGIQSNFRNIFSGKDKCLNTEQDGTLLMTPCKNTDELTWQITQVQ